MKREVILPESRDQWLHLRKQDVTSTGVSALFGISPYRSVYQLFNEKARGWEDEIKDNARMLWGRRLERSVAEGIAKDNRLEVRPLAEYIRIPELRIGSSFDFETPDMDLFEVKTVDSLTFKNDWFELPDGGFAAPRHIELHVQHQLAVTGRGLCYLAVLVGGNRAHLLYRVRDEKTIDEIFQKVKQFWTMVDANQPPPPDYDRDCKNVAKMYSYAEPNKVISGTAEVRDWALEHKDLSVEIKDLQKTQGILKAKILEAIGDAERVEGEGFTISAGMTSPVKISEYERKGWRQFKINRKKS